MKAIRMHFRGGAEQLVYEEAPIPVLEPGDALVRDHAIGITPTELSWSATYTTREGVERPPVVLYTIGGDTLEESWGVLCPGGFLVTLAGTISEEKAAAR